MQCTGFSFLVSTWKDTRHSFVYFKSNTLFFILLLDRKERKHWKTWADILDVIAAFVCTKVLRFKTHLFHSRLQYIYLYIYILYFNIFIFFFSVQFFVFHNIANALVAVVNIHAKAKV